MAQGVGHEFKPQYKKKKQRNLYVTQRKVFCYSSLNGLRYLPAPLPTQVITWLPTILFECKWELICFLDCLKPHFLSDFYLFPSVIFLIIKSRTSLKFCKSRPFFRVLLFMCTYDLIPVQGQYIIFLVV
jgi:hypothetical protein